LGVRGEGGRLAHSGLQGRPARPPAEPPRCRPHQAVRRHAAAIGKLSARTLVLDGEIAIYDQQLRSRFEWLRDPDPDAVASPPLFMVFDLLYHDRRHLTGRPLRDRRTTCTTGRAFGILLYAMSGHPEDPLARLEARTAEARAMVQRTRARLKLSYVVIDRTHTTVADSLDAARRLRELARRARGAKSGRR
jgi:hypothetical protein